MSPKKVIFRLIPRNYPSISQKTLTQYTRLMYLPCIIPKALLNKDLKGFPSPYVQTKLKERSGRRPSGSKLARNFSNEQIKY